MDHNLPQLAVSLWCTSSLLPSHKCCYYCCYCSCCYDHVVFLACRWPDGAACGSSRGQPGSGTGTNICIGSRYCDRCACHDTIELPTHTCTHANSAIRHSHPADTPPLTHTPYPTPHTLPSLAQARVLIEAGATLTVKDRWGYTALDVAHKVGFWGSGLWSRV